MILKAGAVDMVRVPESTWSFLLLSWVIEKVMHAMASWTGPTLPWSSTLNPKTLSPCCAGFWHLSGCVLSSADEPRVQHFACLALSNFAHDDANKVCWVNSGSREALCTSLLRLPSAGRVATRRSSPPCRGSREVKP